jgi:hypothetical protein
LETSEDEIGGAFGTYGTYSGEEKCMEGFGVKTGNSQLGLPRPR